jgi:hypothetical protein
MTDPVRVRLVGDTRAQLVGAAITLATFVVVIAYARRRHYLPFLATRTARRLRSVAQRIEDAGLDAARGDTA